MKSNLNFFISALIVAILAGCTLDNISDSVSSGNILNSDISVNSSSNNSSNNSNSSNSDSNINLDNGWTYSGDYYDSLDFDSLTLATDLSNLITTTHTYETSYDELASIFKESDKDLNKPGNIIWFYSGTSVSYSGDFGGNVGDTNREHVFPKRSGKAFNEKSKAGSDAHHLRPANCQLNSTRGSLNFNEVEQTSSNICKENGSTSYNSDKDKLCYKSNGFFYPGKGFRGQTARIIFYVVSRWEKEFNLSLVDGAGSIKTLGDVSTLLKWNLEEPVNANEIHRNNVVYGIQGNRNPFIDNPNFACSIYGSVSEKAKEVCKKASHVTSPNDNNSNSNDKNSNANDNLPSNTTSNNSSTPSDDTSSNIPSDGQTYSLVTTLDELTENGQYIIAANSANVAMGNITSQYGTTVDISINDNKIVLNNNDVMTYSIIKQENSYKLSCSNGFLGTTSVKKICYDDGTLTWNISFSGNDVIIASTNSNCGKLQYNSQSPRFTTYTSTQTAISLYKKDI